MEHNLVSSHRADILVIDDIPDNIRLLSIMLLKQGYSVRKALSGEIGITAAQIAPPDLILLDINMPEMNGYEVCKILKSNAQTHSIPVIFLSALDDVIDKIKAFQVGGVDFITKPFYFEEVVIRIQTQLTIRNLQAQLQAQNLQLQQALYEVKKPHSQHTENEKMVSSGQLMGGVIHEINNTNNFIFRSPDLVFGYIQKLLNIISTYQKEYPNPTIIVKQAEEKVDLDFIVSEIKKLVE